MMLGRVWAASAAEVIAVLVVPAIVADKPGFRAKIVATMSAGVP